MLPINHQKNIKLQVNLIAGVIDEVICWSVLICYLLSEMDNWGMHFELIIDDCLNKLKHYKQLKVKLLSLGNFM